MSPYEVTQLYQYFAADGHAVPLRAVPPADPQPPRTAAAPFSAPPAPFSATAQVLAFVGSPFACNSQSMIATPALFFSY